MARIPFLDRREFLRLSSSCAIASAFSIPSRAWAQSPSAALKADYALRIRHARVELAPNHVISTTTYNGQVPGPLVRLKEGQRTTIDIFNDTDVPEQLHWHGQKLPVDVDGTAEEGGPYIPAHGMRRITFGPGPAGFRFYHSHLIAGSNLGAGLYSGQAGPVYIEPAHESGQFDREVFLVLKEFAPSLSRGGDMAMDFLRPEAVDPKLKEAGESAMAASLKRGMPHGYEVGYELFSINGRMLGHGEPIKVKAGERVMFHVLNASATEIRSLALPGHLFTVVALDGNPVPSPARVPAIWIGTAERVSAIVQMDHPGVWIFGDLDDDDRPHGLGAIVEYAGATGPPQWAKPENALWDYTVFGSGTAATPDETIDMLIEKNNAVLDGFNQWTINGTAFSMAKMNPMFRIRQGRRYRIRMRNATDDIHPVHLHRHSFELTRIAGKPTAGVIKDVVMLGGYQQIEFDFVADNPGRTLFHCHQQLHMDFGFMALFDYV